MHKVQFTVSLSSFMTLEPLMRAVGTAVGMWLRPESGVEVCQASTQSFWRWRPEMKCEDIHPEPSLLAQVSNLFLDSLTACAFLCVCTSALIPTLDSSPTEERQRWQVNWVLKKGCDVRVQRWRPAHCEAWSRHPTGSVMKC